MQGKKSWFTEKNEQDIIDMKKQRDEIDIRLANLIHAEKDRLLRAQTNANPVEKKVDSDLFQPALCCHSCGKHVQVGKISISMERYDKFISDFLNILGYVVLCSTCHAKNQEGEKEYTIFMLISERAPLLLRQKPRIWKKWGKHSLVTFE